MKFAKSKKSISSSSSVESLNKELECYLDVEERDQKKVQPQTLRRLFRIMLKHHWVLIFGFVTILFGTTAILLEPRIFGYAIDDAIIPRRWDHLKILGLFFVIVTLVRVGAAIQQGYLFELLGQKVTQDLRMGLFSHLQRMPVSLFDKNPAGRLLTRVTNDIASLNEMFSAGFVSMICNILLVIGILTWLITLDLRLALIASAVFPVLIVLSIYFSGQLRVSYRDSRSKLSALNSFLAENLAGMKIVHLFNRQKLHLERFSRLSRWYADAQVSSIRIFALFQPTITICAGVSITLVIWFGGVETIGGHLPVGVLVAYFSYILALFQPVREIADKWNIFLSGMASAERIFSILDWTTELEKDAVQSPSNPIPELKGHILFENVWFAYEGENWVLKEFNLEVHPGERIGVVGHTGAGKTTLISLLLRFYEPQRGRILLDGKDLKDYDKRSLRASIGIVQQDVFLFSGSFEENITFGKKVDPKKVKAILSSLGFDEQIHRMEDGLLEERGSNFSMGERQVIAFARAMVSDPKIWILDEATANMDSRTEAVLQQALNQMSAKSTTLLIAHRLATVRSSDRIIVLHKGHLVEIGDHETLMNRNGLYAKLYRYQANLSISMELLQGSSPL